MRNLPRSYAYNSTYALFPFSTPTTMEAILEKNGVLDKYDMRRPEPAPPVHGTSTHAGAMYVLSKPDAFGVIYDESIKACSNSYGYFISLDDPDAHRRDRDIQSKALFPYGWQDEMKKFYAEKTAELIEKSSWNYVGKTMMLDVVRDVTNVSSPTLPRGHERQTDPSHGRSSPPSTGARTSLASPSRRRRRSTESSRRRNCESRPFPPPRADS